MGLSVEKSGRKGVQYKHPNDFLNHLDAYTALLDHKFAIIAKSRTYFGSLPNRSPIDLASFPKIEEAIKAMRIIQYTNHDNMIIFLIFLVGSPLCSSGARNRQALSAVAFVY